MNSQYGVFGSIVKEPPQLTMARCILDVGRDATETQIKKRYYELAQQWHPDKHMGKPSQQEAAQRMAMYAPAWALLKNSDSRTKASREFTEALQQPVIIGDRVFSLGQLYGVRIYIPQSRGAAIQDPRRLLTSSTQGVHYEPQAQIAAPKISIHGIRQSVLESKISDALVTYYGGTPIGRENTARWDTAFADRHEGGLDDLEWIKRSDLAVHHFMHGKYDQAAGLMRSTLTMIRGNIIFMYRTGVSLEALAATPQVKAEKRKWEPTMQEAIGLYEQCLGMIRKRSELFAEDGEESKSWNKLYGESQLTVMMQLADAYDTVGSTRKAQELWKKILDIDPHCTEAQFKARKGHLLSKSSVLGILGRKIAGLLPGSSHE
jgi:hypothetical protein